MTEKDIDPEFQIPAFQTRHSGTGMSLRDYFAIHGEEPSQVEILTHEGMVQGADGIYGECNDQVIVKKSFYVWWNKKPIQDRFAICAKVRYLMADAMLKARQS